MALAIVPASINTGDQEAASLLAQLKEDATCPETSADVVHMIQQWSKRWGKEFTTCIFPECGSAFHEWQIVSMLMQNGFEIREVAFMDAMLDPAWSTAVDLMPETWTDVWNKLANQYHVNLFTFTDYQTLAKFAERSLETSLVIYVNGVLRCSAAHQPLNPRDALIGAALFWKWCSIYAVNEPLNFRSYWTQPFSWKPWETLHQRL